MLIEDSYEVGHACLACWPREGATEGHTPAAQVTVEHSKVLRLAAGHGISGGFELCGFAWWGV